MAAKSRTIGRSVNGWIFGEVFGDRDFYGGDYMLRAVAAMLGYGGNDFIEAMYPLVRYDDAGEPLDGAHRYQISLHHLATNESFLVDHHV